MAQIVNMIQTEKFIFLKKFFSSLLEFYHIYFLWIKHNLLGNIHVNVRNRPEPCSDRHLHHQLHCVIQISFENQNFEKLQFEIGLLRARRKENELLHLQFTSTNWYYYDDVQVFTNVEINFLRIQFRV